MDVIVNQIVFEEPLISESKKPHLRRLIYSKFPRNQFILEQLVTVLFVFSHRQIPELIEKLESNENSDFFLFKILRAHILPLTNCAFNKSGDKFITGSYDRTCKVWNTITGDELLTLEGHRNVVYAIAFNNPYGDKIITGSFGKSTSLTQSFLRLPVIMLYLFVILFKIKRVNYGMLKLVLCIIHSEAMLPKSYVYRSIHTALWLPLGRWTILRAFGMLRRVSAFIPF